MPTEKYKDYETSFRGYEGIQVAADEGEALLATSVKENLADREEQQRFQADLEEVKGSIEQTGFKAPEELLIDIQAFNNQVPEDTRSWRIGESIAEVVLEGEYGARFYWNELRDARNPHGNKTGTDLVGFIETDGEVLFLFGEVKTSSEQRRPPQVMTKSDGMENQLRDLYSNPKKQKTLIKYLASKTRNLAPTDPFKKDYSEALKNYYYPDDCKCQLFGVLVRDIEADEEDLSHSYARLKSEILEPAGLRLLAVYMSIKKENWEAIINQSDQN